MNIYERKAELMRERKVQEALRDKYGIEENVVVKETSNMGKYLIKVSGIVIRVSVSIVIAILTATGVTTLAYPQIRSELFIVVKQAFDGLVQ